MNKKRTGIFIQNLRKEKDLTQEQLAEILAVDRTTISKWERGVYSPSNELLLKMEDIFNVGINEILYGERKTEENKKEVEMVSVNLIKAESKKKKNVMIISLIVISILIISILTYYFINNYNSIRVYKISGENEFFYINDGIMIVSREKSYIKLGNVKKKENKEILKLNLLYKNNKKDNLIVSGGEDETEDLLENEFNYNELFKYSDINYLINNLHLEVIVSENEKYDIKLRVKKDFANNQLFTKNIKNISEENTSYKTNKNIPDYVKQNFEIDTEKEKYYRNYTFNNYSQSEEYYYEINLYTLCKSFKEYTEFYNYNVYDGYLNYHKIINENDSNNFTYNMMDKKCIIGECDIKKIESIKKRIIELGFTDN